jgi:DNA-binding transcriptional ArsR family regulator
MRGKYALPGIARQNKAETLYLLKGHEPRHRKFMRKDPDAGIAVHEHVADGTIHERVVEAAVKNEKDAAWAYQWEETMKRITARYPEKGHRNREMEERFGPEGFKVTEQEAESAWEGQPPENENLPDWIQAAVDKKGNVVQTVRLALEFKGHPVAFRTIYGLLDRYSHGSNTTWVSVERLARESGYTPQYVGRILRRMEKKGLIKTEMRPGQSSVYTLLASPPGVFGLLHRVLEKTTEPFIDLGKVRELE